MVQRLEADLGVKVQEVRFPELRHSANIWLSCMDLPDEDGKVGPADNLIQSTVFLHVQNSDWASRAQYQFSWNKNKDKHCLIKLQARISHSTYYSLLPRNVSLICLVARGQHTTYHTQL